MPVAATPTDRLNIYLQDFERAHDQVAPLSSSRRVKGRDAFTAWREALAQVDAAHRCGGARTDANGFATPPLFALSSITITSVLGHGSAAALADAERLLTFDHRTWQRIEDPLLDSDAGLLAHPGTGSAPVGAFSEAAGAMRRVLGARRGRRTAAARHRLRSHLGTCTRAGAVTPWRGAGRGPVRASAPGRRTQARDRAVGRATPPP